MWDVESSKGLFSHVSMKLYAGGLRNLHVAISEYWNLHLKKCMKCLKMHNYGPTLQQSKHSTVQK